ncbi:uncharacterized protein MONOS_503 [Monocercomonoides exilis]|uniref:uncharacterized protein n=1 Tax=Monocercomonoides exilis TaxID=2049356 RepID=UPI0035597E3D|nr:hypothetical protein MONOS_503 [Monocercomonoides exilis]|eukprot:MONOS_503.1-p1 / transcript=MONOS_503.1 / gene=MONOS_503 / organism=Monocercomonoides_exilis_PA203 / gene_product=unspecified product / transcript_product=unspecified product / location=Mono_scaffold00008:51116-54649(-) / protein_length=1178 / sequence_SO=supercontig / SO=protein_coding / is_pseudo=false
MEMKENKKLRLLKLTQCGILIVEPSNSSDEIRRHSFGSVMNKIFFIIEDEVVGALHCGDRVSIVGVWEKKVQMEIRGIEKEGLILNGTYMNAPIRWDMSVRVLTVKRIPPLCVSLDDYLPESLITPPKPSIFHSKYSFQPKMEAECCQSSSDYYNDEPSTSALFGDSSEEEICNSVIGIVARLSTLSSYLGMNSFSKRGLFNNLQMGMLLSLVNTASQAQYYGLSESETMNRANQLKTPEFTDDCPFFLGKKNQSENDFFQKYDKCKIPSSLSPLHQINILVIGDSGGVIRQMMKRVSSWISRWACYNNPLHSSLQNAVGEKPLSLSASFNRGSDASIEWTNAGCLALARGGVCFIPHGNLLKKKDVEVLYGVMRGTYQINQQSAQELYMLPTLIEDENEEEEISSEKMEKDESSKETNEEFPAANSSSKDETNHPTISSQHLHHISLLRESSNQSCAVWMIIERDRRKGKGETGKDRSNSRGTSEDDVINNQLSLGANWTKLPDWFLDHFDLVFNYPDVQSTGTAAVGEEMRQEIADAILTGDEECSDNESFKNSNQDITEGKVMAFLSHICSTPPHFNENKENKQQNSMFITKEHLQKDTETSPSEKKHSNIADVKSQMLSGLPPPTIPLSRFASLFLLCYFHGRRLNSNAPIFWFNRLSSSSANNSGLSNYETGSAVWKEKSRLSQSELVGSDENEEQFDKEDSDDDDVVELDGGAKRVGPRTLQTLLSLSTTIARLMGEWEVSTAHVIVACILFEECSIAKRSGKGGPRGVFPSIHRTKKIGSKKGKTNSVQNIKMEGDEQNSYQKIENEDMNDEKDDEWKDALTEYTLFLCRVCSQFVDDINGTRKRTSSGRKSKSLSRFQTPTIKRAASAVLSSAFSSPSLSNMSQTASIFTPEPMRQPSRSQWLMTPATTPISFDISSPSPQLFRQSASSLKSPFDLDAENERPIEFNGIKPQWNDREDLALTPHKSRFSSPMPPPAPPSSPFLHAHSFQLLPPKLVSTAQTAASSQKTKAPNSGTVSETSLRHLFKVAGDLSFEAEDLFQCDIPIKRRTNASAPIGYNSIEHCERAASPSISQIQERREVKANRQDLHAAKEIEKHNLHWDDDLFEQESQTTSSLTTEDKQNDPNDYIDGISCQIDPNYSMKNKDFKKIVPSIFSSPILQSFHDSLFEP